MLLAVKFCSISSYEVQEALIGSRNFAKNLFKVCVFDDGTKRETGF